MKILLDECVTKKLRPHLPDHQVLTVTEQHWNGLRNGLLLSAAVREGFNLLLTVDKNILYQQNLTGQPIIVVVFDTSSSKIEELVKFIPKFNLQLAALKTGQLYVLGLG